ncbi:putative holin-like toxin [Rummeliibacillus sp. SL167]|nr:putative holin-like toxin [Rummeliibacillus sp. SL167]
MKSYEVLSLVAQFNIVLLTALTLIVTIIFHLNKKK